MAAAGAQIAVFSTGSGSVCGHAIVPTFKITANEETYSRMPENVDYLVSMRNSGSMQLDRAGMHICEELIGIACGKLTKAEKLNQDDFLVPRVNGP
jgi:altronate dehydratase large subunit